MTDRFVCSDASEARGEAVTATASQVRGWLLVEVHGAWGTDAIHDSPLGPHVPDGWAAGLKRRGIRPICIRPPHRGPSAAAIRVFFVVTTRPGTRTGRAWVRAVPTLAAVRYLTDDLRLDAEPAGWTAHDERLVLVCTNGKHDQCCANRGRPVIRHLRETPWAEQLWECSHIGGDRFAANIVVLPDGLYYGRMEPTDAERLLDAHAVGEIALPWYRGRSTLRFAEQAAEHAVRERYGIVGVDDVVVVPGEGHSRIRVEARGLPPVEVHLRRTVALSAEPLTCHGSPQQQVPTYTVADIVELTDR
ncbi:MAG: sucrase ferredoxin [Acidimicrobiales bacterium]|nr:sucrase ferredoxin [Acidimicrobiales bacterium]